MNWHELLNLFRRYLIGNGGTATLNHMTLTISVSTIVENGTAPILSAHALKADNSPFTGATNLRYTSDNPSIAAVDSAFGTVDLNGPGVVNFTVSDTISGKTASVALTVTAAPPPPPTLGTVTLSISSGSAVLGATPPTLTVVARDTNNNVMTGLTPVYSVNDASIASVDVNTGAITMIKAGTVHLQADIGAVHSNIVDLTITPFVPPTPQLLTITPSSLVTGGTNVSFVGTGVDLPTDMGLLFSNAGMSVVDVTRDDAANFHGHFSCTGGATPGAGTVRITSATAGNSPTKPFNVTTPGSQAWNSASPLASALVSDWFGRDNANIAAIQANTSGKYSLTTNTTYYPQGFGKRSGPADNISFDSSPAYGGYPVLVTQNGNSGWRPRLTITNFATQTDIVYHIRKANRVRTIPDCVPAMTIPQRNSSNTWNALYGFAFDNTSYAQPGWDYDTAHSQANPRPAQGILLGLVDDGATLRYRYQLTASIWSTGGVLLSDETSRQGILGNTVGDEQYDGNMDNYFVRVQKVSNTLVITAYYNVDGVEPKLICGPLTLSMINGSAPPMPKFAMHDINFASNISVAGSRAAFHQILDNAGHPDTAMSFSTVGSWGNYGRGHKAIDIGEVYVDLEQFADTTALRSAMSVAAPHQLIPYAQAATILSLHAADAAHGNKKFIRWDNVVGTSGAGLDLVDTIASPDVWFTEIFKASPNWTNQGSGSFAVSYKMWQINFRGDTTFLRLELAGQQGQLYINSTSQVVDTVHTVPLGNAPRFSTPAPTSDGVFYNNTNLPETDWVNTVGDGSVTKPDLGERQVFFHIKRYVDPADGLNKAMFECFIGFVNDPAPYYYGGIIFALNQANYAAGISSMHWGENQNKGPLYDQYVDRREMRGRSVEQFGPDPFGILAARAAAVPKPVLSQVNKSKTSNSVTNTVKPYPLTTKLRPVVDGVSAPSDGSADILVPTTLVPGNGFDIVHAGQATGAHTYSYKSVNANGVVNAVVGAVSVTV